MGGDFLARIKLALEGKEKVVSGLQETQHAAQQLTKTKITTIFDKEGVATGKQIQQTFANIGQEGKKSFQAMGDFEKAMRRVILVAPVWMAFRAGIQAVTGTVQQGFRTWEEFDRAMIKAKAVVHDSTGSIDKDMVILEDTIRKFSRESGIALKDLAASFYRFGTVGIQFQDAMSGAIASAKLAKATLGDTDTISRSLAMTYRLLGDTIESSLRPMEKQESLAGKIYYLWKTNAFEANEFSQSLNNFVSTANIANFTADETIATLAALGTAGVQGSRGGALLKTSIQKLVENLDILAPRLGLAVNPELEDTFSLFMRVLGAINDLSKTTGIPKEALKSIQEIFGGVRGAQVISALNALLPELRQNLIDMGKDPQEYIEGLNNRVKEVENSLSGQIDIFKNLRAQIGEAFVKGVAGGKDFKDALVNINQITDNAIIGFEQLGKVLSFIFLPLYTVPNEIKKINAEATDFGKRVDDALAGLLSVDDTLETINIIADKWGRDAFTEDVMRRIRETAIRIVETRQVQEEANKAVEEFNEKYIQAENKRKEKVKQLSVELQDRLALSKQEFEILELQKAGVDEVIVANVKLDKIVNVLVDRYNNLEDASGKTVAQISKQEVIASILAGDFEKVLNIFKEMDLTEQEINSLASAYANINKAILNDLDKRVDKVTDILKVTNEEESAIIRQEMALKAMIYGEDYIKSSMEDRVRLAQALTKEADEQEKKSASLVTLYKIAKKFGLDAARQISEFIGGTRKFSELSTTAVRGLRKEATSLYEQGRAEEFFRGAAFIFPEDIEKQRKARRNIGIVENIQIEPIQINVELESEKVIDKVKARIVQELDDKKSAFAQKIQEQIENF